MIDTTYFYDTNLPLMQSRWLTLILSQVVDCGEEAVFWLWRAVREARSFPCGQVI